MVNRIFDKKNVILLKVNEDDLNTFLVDMDIDDKGNPQYCLDDFTKAICNTIPEYVFAQYENPNIPQNDIVEKLREAAHCIYKIKDFQLMKQWCVDKAELSARKIVIHVLNNWGKIDKNLYVVWADLIETLGFYPYIQKNSSDLKIMSFADDVRMSYFQSDFLKNTYLHKEQKKISNYLLSGKNIIASAPTSFGKSLLIEEIVASKKYKNIVIIQPTLSCLVRIITFIEVIRFSISFQLPDNAICIFWIILSNESFNARRIKDRHIRFDRINRLADRFRQINKVIKNELNIIHKILFKTSDLRSIWNFRKATEFAQWF